MYIGPSILRAIPQYMVIRGSKEEALKDPRVEFALSVQPKIAPLIVDGSRITRARKEAATPGTYLNRLCREITNELNKEE